jgi:hypothetical protein
MLRAMSSDPQNASGTGETGSDTPGEADEPRRARRRGPPPNPLYHPLFLPVLLVVYSLWFGYDGFLSDPEYEHRTFNQVMFGVTAVLCLWVVPRGIREFRQDRAKAGHRQDDGNGA